MQVTSLVQDLIRQIISEIDSLNTRGINLGDLLTAQVKSVQGESVLIRVQGRDILAKTLIPLQVGETITFQYQGLVEGKAVFKLVNEQLSHQEENYVQKTLHTLRLPVNETNREIVRQMIQRQLPLDKQEISQLSSIAGKLKLSPRDVGEAVILHQQGLPVTQQNITLLREFSQGSLNLFKGLETLKEPVNSNQPLPPRLKEAVVSFLNKLQDLQIKSPDTNTQTAAKLAGSLQWQAVRETPAPFVIIRDQTFRHNSEALNQTSAQVPTADLPPSAKNIVQRTTPSVNQPASAQEPRQSGFDQANLTLAATSAGTNTYPVGTNAKPAVDSPQAKDAVNHVHLKELILQRLELLSKNEAIAPDKLNTLLHKIRAIPEPVYAELKALSKDILMELKGSAPFPGDAVLNDFFRDFSEKITFVERFVQSAPSDNSQQVIYYSQALIRSDNNTETPVNIIIKRPRDKMGSRIDFHNCTLSVSLNTLNLGTVRATVKKAANTLTCQVTVTDDLARQILEPALPQLAESLEKLGYQVAMKGVHVERTMPPQLETPGREPLNLFNIDIRI